MSYALVFWVNSQQTSIVPSIAVSDKRMLTDNKRVGKIKWIDEKRKIPPEGDGLHTMDVFFQLVVKILGSDIIKGNLLYFFLVSN